MSDMFLMRIQYIPGKFVESAYNKVVKYSINLTLIILNWLFFKNISYFFFFYFFKMQVSTCTRKTLYMVLSIHLVVQRGA